MMLTRMCVGKVLLGALLAVATLWGATGCDNCCTPAPAQAEVTPMPPPTTPSKPAAEPVQAGTVAIAYPTGDRATSFALLEKKVPTEVNVGQSFDMVITVTNLSGSMYLTEVVVEDPLPANFKVEKMEPMPASNEGGMAKWNLGRIPPRGVQTIRIRGSAGQSGTLVQCASLSCVPQVCVEIVAVSPALRLTKTAPADALVCDPIPVKIVVTNTGTGMARNVKVQDALPAGLTTDKGAAMMEMDAGTLATGQSKEFVVNLKAGKTGKFENKAVAIADGGLKAEASTSTMVRVPVLAITKTGQAEQYLGRPVTYDITVTNKGDWVAKDTVLTDTVPVGLKVTDATAGSQMMEGRVQWQLGNIDPGGSKKVSLTVSGETAGMYRDVAKASAYCAEPVTASVDTTYRGIPAILLETRDDPDPVQVGKTTTYTISVTNQGTAADTNIKLVAKLESTEEFVSAGGDAKATAAGGTITFATIPTLAPKAKMTMTVTVKAVKAGDTRFHVSMTSDQLGRPVEHEESTNLFE